MDVRFVQQLLDHRLKLMVLGVMNVKNVGECFLDRLRGRMVAHGGGRF
jgi:hypothetical protein